MEYSYFKRTILSAAAEDGSVHFWDTNRSASPTQSFHNAHLDSATSLAFSPYNKFLMSTCGLDRKIVLYDVERSGIVKTIATESPLSSIAFKSDGVTLAVGTTQGKLYIYDLRHGMKPVESIWAHEPYAIRAVAFQLPEMRRTIKPSTKSAKKVVPKVEEIGSSKPTLNLSTTSTAPTSIASKLNNKAETVAPETPKNRLLKTEKANYMDMFSPVHTVDIGKLSGMILTIDSLTGYVDSNREGAYISQAFQ
ncbi:WD40-repeat-containing domain protein [Paraphysoderma sedebokerense]|nr:WD40-repeat-containing domain protein [Paraphysoderma sedebokerense]